MVVAIVVAVLAAEMIFLGGLGIWAIWEDWSSSEDGDVWAEVDAQHLNSLFSRAQEIELGEETLRAYCLAQRVAASGASLLLSWEREDGAIASCPVEDVDAEGATALEIPVALGSEFSARLVEIVFGEEVDEDNLLGWAISGPPGQEIPPGEKFISREYPEECDPWEEETYVS